MSELPVSGSDPLSYSVSHGSGYVVVAVAGEIDAATECVFREELASALARGQPRVVVDLAGVRFMTHKRHCSRLDRAVPR